MGFSATVFLTSGLCCSIFFGFMTSVLGFSSTNGCSTVFCGRAASASLGSSSIISLTGSIFWGVVSCFLEIESLIFWKNPFFSGTLSIGFSITSPSSSTFLEKRAMPCFSFSFKNLNIFLGFDECVELLLERNSLGSELVDLVSNLFLEPVNFDQLLSQKSFYACEILVYHNP